MKLSQRSKPAVPPLGRSVYTGPALTAALLALAGCASPTHRAPVEERVPAARTSTAPAAASTASGGTSAAPAAAAPEAAPPKPLPGAENAGKPGYYTVKPGDTLIRVGLENGQNWRDIARWSGLENPNIIEVGQVLRVVPPSADANGVVARPVQPAGRVDGRPLDPRAGDSKPAGAASSPAAPVSSTPAAAPAAQAAATTPAPAPSSAVQVPREPDEDVAWAWPAAGTVVTPFDDNKSRGLAITGKAGDPVLAAADGRVVYAGSALRGYGNLVIVKHNATYLTAYAHNQTLLVKEDQVVRRGQKIAEMGSSDAERVQLHFEIRRLGKPVDPARLLPQR
jgi:lipoprotein NlpD